VINITVVKAGKCNFEKARRGEHFYTDLV